MFDKSWRLCLIYSVILPLYWVPNYKFYWRHFLLLKRKFSGTSDMQTLHHLTNSRKITKYIFSSSILFSIIYVFIPSQSEDFKDRRISSLIHLIDVLVSFAHTHRHLIITYYLEYMGMSALLFAL